MAQYYKVAKFTSEINADSKIESEINSIPVKQIDSNAFKSCSSLISIEIPDSITSIGDEAFWGCPSLTSIEIPNSVTSIGDAAFSWCYSLINIDVAEDNPNYKDIDGNLYTKDGTTLIQYAIGKTATEFIIPDSITSIGEDAFANCESLTNIEIPNSVTSIDSGAFGYCDALTSIEIPNSVTSIGSGAFSNCHKFTSIEIPDSVTSIGSSAFSWCYSLTNVTIGNSVTSIGRWAFANCSNLQTITLNAIIPPILQTGSFDSIVFLNEIKVPEGSLNAYKTDTNWIAYADIISAIDD